MRVNGSWIMVTRNENEMKISEDSLIILPTERYFDNPCVTVKEVGPGGVVNGYKEYMDMKPGDTMIVDNIWTDAKNTIPGTDPKVFYIQNDKIECLISWIEENEES